MVVLGLAGDTMLGRGVAERLAVAAPTALVAPSVVAIAQEADLLVLNLECCISERGAPWQAPGKRFFFRAPPRAVEVLTLLGVDCMTLANNHALDYRAGALLDTLAHLETAGIAWVGAGSDVERARAPTVLEADDYRLTVIGVTDHPSDFAASTVRPGVAWADLRGGVPGWLRELIGASASTVLRSVGGSGVVVSPHWGPNMVNEPRPYVQRAAQVLCEAGATLVAGHSAHVFHGLAGSVLFDLGDFLDDYATNEELRNDLGLLFLVELDAGGPVRLDAVPLTLEFCHTRLASGEEFAWIARRFRLACAAFGTEARVDDGRLVVNWS